MSVYIGSISGKFYHTYSKKLCAEHFGDDYVSVFSLVTGREGGVKIRGSTALSKILKNTKEEVPLIIVVNG